MATVKYTEKSVVWFDIRGEAVRNMDARADDGLVVRFLKWQLEAGIFPAVRAGHSGGGRWAGAFSSRDAIIVRAWLAENAVDEVETWR